MQHTTSHLGHVSERRDGRRDDRFDWASQVKLALVLSVVAVIVAVGLAGRVAEPVIVIGMMAVASVLAWRRVDVAPAARPATVRVRHR